MNNPVDRHEGLTLDSEKKTIVAAISANVATAM